jgi:hypothetical protein
VRKQNASPMLYRVEIRRNYYIADSILLIALRSPSKRSDERCDCYKDLDWSPVRRAHLRNMAHVQCTTNQTKNNPRPGGFDAYSQKQSWYILAVTFYSVQMFYMSNMSSL